MRLVTCLAEGHWELGVVADEYVAVIPEASSPQVSPMRSAFERGPQELDSLRSQAEQRFRSGEGVVRLDSLRLAPPIPDPDKILCVGFNYRDHATEMEFEVPAAPAIFAKFRPSLIGSGADVILPATSEQVDYEGELAAVIGRHCRSVGADEALQYVAGYTAFNDVSARDLQFRTSQWTLGKAIDTFAPCGPVVTLADEIADPQSLELTTRVNGEVVQHDSTRSMIFSVASCIATISSVMTLVPGDIIATGTPAGVGYKRTPPRFLAGGDVVEVEISGIGVLRNEIVGSELLLRRDGDERRREEAARRGVPL
jgi:2-keto-4-pentenoate hydratase/2-oxohepta-3-ene-1,7-dioic acid hydratase in catechol pathway